MSFCWPVCHLQTSAAAVLLQTAKQLVPQVLILQLWSFLVPSAALGSIGSPLARRYGGIFAIFSLSEAEGFLPRIAAWSFIQNESV